MFGPALRRFGIYSAGGELRGGFCLYEERRLGLKILRNPPFTPQVGPFFEWRSNNASAQTEERRAAVEAMAESVSGAGAAVVSLGLSFGVTDCLPFYWRRYRVIPHYTYRIDLRSSENEILAAMSAKTRNHILKAAKDQIAVEEAAETGELRTLVGKSFSKQNKRFSRQSMDGILNGYPPGSSSFCILSRLHELPIAGVYVVHDAHTAFNLMTGYDSSNAHHGAGPAAMYRAILKAKSLGLHAFDFEGSVIPPIERYFRGFGGQLTPVFSVHKAWLPLELVLKFRYRQQF